MEFQTQFQNLTKRLPISMIYRVYIKDMDSLSINYVVLQHNYCIKCWNYIALSCALASKFHKEYFIIATQIKFKHFNLVRSTQCNAKLYRYCSNYFISNRISCSIYIYLGLALRYLKLAHSYAQPSQNISNKSNTFNLESVVPW